MAKQATLEAAERVIEACKKRAEEIGTPMKMVAPCLAMRRGQVEASLRPSWAITVLPRYSGSMSAEPST